MIIIIDLSFDVDPQDAYPKVYFAFYYPLKIEFDPVNSN